MKIDEVLVQLEDLASKLGVEVRYDRNFRGSGGLCKVRDKYWLIMNRGLNTSEKVEIFIENLKRFDLEGIFVSPRVREIMGLDEAQGAEAVHDERSAPAEVAEQVEVTSPGKA